LDTPGYTPLTGGSDQPTWLRLPDAGHIVVAETANGIDSQPVELLISNITDYGSLDYSFAPIDDRVLRVEATVAFSDFMNGYFLQTASAGYVVVSRLSANSRGEIFGNSAQGIVGTYRPEKPFRVRMDVDMSSRLWSAAIDDELNGFADDPVIADMAVWNGSIPQDVRTVAASLKFSINASLQPTTVAYDDLSIRVVPEPGGLALLLVGCIAVGFRRNALAADRRGSFPT